MVQSQERSDLTIAGLAAAGGVGVETVRFYQRKGLLDEPRRRGGAIRHYGPAYVQRLRFIRSAQVAGFTLEEIKALIALDATRDRPKAREIAKARIAELDKRIAEMQDARDALKRLAAEYAKPTKGACPIIEAFTHSP